MQGRVFQEFSNASYLYEKKNIAHNYSYNSYKQITKHLIKRNIVTDFNHLAGGCTSRDESFKFSIQSNLVDAVDPIETGLFLRNIRAWYIFVSLLLIQCRATRCDECPLPVAGHLSYSAICLPLFLRSSPSDPSRALISFLYGAYYLRDGKL